MPELTRFVIPLLNQFLKHVSKRNNCCTCTYRRLSPEHRVFWWHTCDIWLRNSERLSTRSNTRKLLYCMSGKTYKLINWRMDNLKTRTFALPPYPLSIVWILYTELLVFDSRVRLITQSQETLQPWVVALKHDAWCMMCHWTLTGGLWSRDLPSGAPCGSLGLIFHPWSLKLEEWWNATRTWRCSRRGARWVIIDNDPGPNHNLKGGSVSIPKLEASECLSFGSSGFITKLAKLRIYDESFLRFFVWH